MATLAEIKAALKKQDEAAEAREQQRNNKSSAGDNAQYPFWDMKVDETAKVRYLPDGDESNIFPWVERQTIELVFDGTTGGERETTEQVKIKVPCPAMFVPLIPDYNVACQITAHIRPWWKPKDGEMYAMAQRYYRKQSWLMQGFVVESPFVEENAPENIIRRFTLTKKIFNKVFKAYNGTEYEAAPHDFDEGTDFVIEKTKQGEFNNYDTSDFSRRSRSLNDVERAAIAEHGLFKLKDFVGKAPTQQDADAMYAMFLDSYAGKPYDFAQFNSFYRPYGVKGPQSQGGGEQSNNTPSNDTPSTPAASQQRETPVETPAAPAEAAPATDTDDLIARIRRNAMK